MRNFCFDVWKKLNVEISWAQYFVATRYCSPKAASIQTLDLSFINKISNLFYQSLQRKFCERKDFGMSKKHVYLSSTFFKLLHYREMHTWIKTYNKNIYTNDMRQRADDLILPEIMTCLLQTVLYWVSEKTIYYHSLICDWVVVRPTLLYGTQCWPGKNSHVQKKHVAEMRKLRWIYGHTRNDKIWNEDIRDKMIVASVVDKMSEVRLR